MILAALVLLAFCIVTFVDWIYFHKNHFRAFVLEAVALVGALAVFLWPHLLQQLADAIGVGRGVDLIIYPAMVWLFREAVLGRVRYYTHQAEITALVRHLAKVGAIPAPTHHSAPTTSIDRKDTGAA